MNPLLPRGPAFAYEAPTGAQKVAAPAFVPPPTGDVETFAITLDGYPHQQERTVYTTRRAWRACDVFLSFSATMTASTVVTVRVYALVPGGGRMLVASGRVGHTLASLIALPRQVVAARSVATAYEVTVFSDALPGFGTNQITVAVAASNEATDPPAGIGEIPYGAAVATSLTASQIPDPEIVWVSGVTGAAVGAPRFLHVRDKAAGLGSGNSLLTLPLGLAGAGGGWPLRLRIRGQLYLYATDAPDLGAVQADCFVQAIVR